MLKGADMSDFTKQYDYSFKVLRDRVAGADAFEDRTHEKASNALYRLIQESDSGFTIGLEGSWGAGKSTVISFLTQKLSNKVSAQASDLDDKNFSFQFDAWAHEGDPLRRVFLESFAKKIQGKIPADASDDLKNTISSIQSSISGTKKSITTKSKKETSNLGKLLAPATFVAPVASFLLVRAYSAEALYFPLSNEVISHYILSTVGWVLTAAPFVVVLLWAIFAKQKNGIKKWEIFGRETSEVSILDTLEAGDKTSIEFEEIFKDLVSFSTSRMGYKKLVIIIDNLDRIDRNQAKHVWGTLQTFFQYRSQAECSSAGFKPEDKLWFVIPFDYTGFCSIWDSSENSDNTDISGSFLDKCFEVIVEVPSPIVSNWIAYFEQHVELALTGWPALDRKQVCKTHLEQNSRLSASPTPREMRTTINLIGSHGLTWGGQFLPESICRYAMYRRQYTAESFRSMLLGSPRVSYPFTELSERVRQELAGLLFGVSAEKGTQLLLIPAINRALDEGDGTLLGEMAERFDEPYWIAWKEISNNSISGSHDIKHIIRFTENVHSGLFKYRKLKELKLERLLEVWMHRSGYHDDFSKSQFAGALVKLMELCEDMPESKALLRKICDQYIPKMISFALQDVTPKDASEINLREVSLLIDLCKSRGIELSGETKTRLDLKSWKKIVSIFAGTDIKISNFSPSKDVISMLHSQAFIAGRNRTAMSLSEENVRALIETVSADPESESWSYVAETCVESIRRASLQGGGHPLVYALLVEIISKANESVRDSLLESVQAREFWKSTKPYLAASVNRMRPTAPRCPVGRAG
jgi:hypothetical protein